MSFTRMRFAHAAFALVEITLVITIIVLLAAMAVPSFLRARKRGQASQVSNGLRVINSDANRHPIGYGKKSCDFVGT
jgi:type II secretory pathway pseudopilin PulG